MRTLAKPTYRLTFMLPRAVARVASARCREFTLDLCELQIVREQWVVITAPSRDLAFDQAARVLTARGAGVPPQIISAVLESPPPAGGRDGWTIILDADVAFAPTGLGAYFSMLQHGPAEKPPPAPLELKASTS